MLVTSSAIAQCKGGTASFGRGESKWPREWREVFFRLLPFPVWLLAHNAGEAGFEPATFSFACDFRSIAWHKVSITRVERSVFSQFLAVAFTIWLLPRLVGEAGFEPALMLVTPGRLRNAN